MQGPRRRCAENAIRAAAQERVVVGGGVALVRASKKLQSLEGENSDQTAGIAIIRRALQAPLRQIAENAGVDGSVVAGKVMESDDPSFGFNAQTEEYGDMFKFGVIDPAKVVRTALQDAASVAGLLITTEAMIADKPDKISLDIVAGLPCGEIFPESHIGMGRVQLSFRTGMPVEGRFPI